MKRKVLHALSIVLMCIMVMTNVAEVNAVAVNEANGTMYSIDNSANEIAPCSESITQSSFRFTISDTGTASIRIIYEADGSNFSQAKVTVKLQKRVLGLFWTTVDIGETDNLWVDYSSDSSGIFSFSTGLGDEGTYRAVITLEVTTTSGTTDVIEDKVQATYG